VLEIHPPRRQILWGHQTRRRIQCEAALRYLKPRWLGPPHVTQSLDHQQTQRTPRTADANLWLSKMPTMLEIPLTFVNDTESWLVMRASAGKHTAKTYPAYHKAL